MSTHLQRIREGIDAIMAAAIADPRNTTKPACKDGCFHCCKEPVYATKDEVIDSLTHEHREEVITNLRKWIATVQPSGLLNVGYPEAIKYRALQAWCPLLKAGRCSVYAQRPKECRFFISADAAVCADDTRRNAEAVFGTITAAIEYAALVEIKKVEDGGTMIADHLGVLLAKHLLNIELDSAMRLELNRESIR